MPFTHCRVESRHIVVSHLRCDLGERILAHQLLQRKVLFAHGASNGILALLYRLVPALLCEPGADLVSRPRALDETEPVLARSGIRILGSEDLHRVSAVEPALERNQPPVHFGAHGAVADLSMHRVGEINGSRTRGQSNHFALRCEDINLFGTDFESKGIEELPRILGLGLPVTDVGEPRHVRIVVTAGAIALAVDACLVFPVRRYSELCPLVHFGRSDLQLDRLTRGADDRRVKRLVEVEFRGGDVVLEPPRNRSPPCVDRPEHGIAVAYRVHEDPNPDEVVDLVEFTTPHNHLLVDRVVLLGTTGHAALDFQGLEVILDRVDDLLHETLTLRRALADKALDLDIEFRIQHSEREVFEFELDRLDSEPVREGRVDLERLFCFAGSR